MRGNEVLHLARAAKMDRRREQTIDAFEFCHEGNNDVKMETWTNVSSLWIKAGLELGPCRTQLQNNKNINLLN
jgi:hypothetical protein